MFESFGDKYHEYMMQVVMVDDKEYLLKRDGSVYIRLEGLHQVTDEEAVKAVHLQAAKDGGWDVINNPRPSRSA
jgi:hypothetical protein